MENGPHVGPNAVDEDTLRHFLKLCEILVRVAFPPEILLCAESLFTLSDAVCDDPFHNGFLFVKILLSAGNIIAEEEGKGKRKCIYGR